MAIEEIVELALGEQPYFKNGGGVTISGGEPLLQAKELIELFKKLKEAGISTALDTNGSILSQEVKELLDLTDLVLLDIKHIEEAGHKKITGASRAVPEAFAKYLKEVGKPVWLRYVLVPGYTDKAQEMEATGLFFKAFENIERLEVLPYHTLGIHKYEHLGMDYALKDSAVPTKAEVEKAKEIFDRYFKKVLVG